MPIHSLIITYKITPYQSFLNTATYQKYLHFQKLLPWDVFISIVLGRTSRQAVSLCVWRVWNVLWKMFSGYVTDKPVLCLQPAFISAWTCLRQDRQAYRKRNRDEGTRLVKKSIFSFCWAHSHAGGVRSAR